MKLKVFHLGRIFGIPVQLDCSWFLIFALLTWSFAAGYYPAQFPAWPVIDDWLVAAATSLLVFASILLHELGHSVVARHYGLPVHNISFFVLGGASRMGGMPPSFAAEFCISIAGPLVSFALAAIFYLVHPVLASITPLVALVDFLAIINGGLGALNLIPASPLDGGHIIRAIAWAMTDRLNQAKRITSLEERFVGLTFVLFGSWKVFSGNLLYGLWISFIGFFLVITAIDKARKQHMWDLLRGHSVAEVMNSNLAAISSETPLQQVTGSDLIGPAQPPLIVESRGRPIGLLDLDQLMKANKTRREKLTVDQAYIPLSEMKPISPETGLQPVLEKMGWTGINQLVVMQDERILGIVTLDQINRFQKKLYKDSH